MYPLEDATTTDNDAVAENTSAPVSLAAQPASAPLYQATVGNKTVSTSVLPTPLLMLYQMTAGNEATEVEFV